MENILFPVLFIIILHAHDVEITSKREEKCSLHNHVKILKSFHILCGVLCAYHIHCFIMHARYVKVIII